MHASTIAKLRGSPFTPRSGFFFYTVRKLSHCPSRLIFTNKAFFCAVVMGLRVRAKGAATTTACAVFTGRLRRSTGAPNASMARLSLSRSEIRRGRICSVGIDDEKGRTSEQMFSIGCAVSTRTVIATHGQL